MKYLLLAFILMISGLEVSAQDPGASYRCTKADQDVYDVYNIGNGYTMVVIMDGTEALENINVEEYSEIRAPANTDMIGVWQGPSYFAVGAAEEITCNETARDNQQQLETDMLNFVRQLDLSVIFHD